MTAPRGLMVISATRDAFQFSVDEAKKSLARAAAIYQLYEQPDQVRHTIFESGHDYSKPMREAMVGWMSRHLRGEGDGKPLAERDIKTEDPEELRCFPAESRPADWMTIPRFAAAEAGKLLAKQAVPTDAAAWAAEARRRRQALTERVLGGFPKPTPLGLQVARDTEGQGRRLTFHPEPGLTLTAQQSLRTSGKTARVTILLDLEGTQRAAGSEFAKALPQDEGSVVTLDLRATGRLAWPRDAVGRAPDHNSAEWALWLGRPLLGQWTWDVRRLLDALTEADGSLPKEVVVIGRGPAGLVALAAVASDERITHVAAVDALASYVTEVPYQGQRLGVLAPGILRDVGDIAHLAALCAPRRLVIAGGVHGSGRALSDEQRRATFGFATAVWQRLGAGEEIRLMASDDAVQVVRALR
jgi:hypothetical protein